MRKRPPALLSVPGLPAGGRRDVLLLAFWCRRAVARGGCRGGCRGRRPAPLRRASESPFVGLGLLSVIVGCSRVLSDISLGA